MKCWSRSTLGVVIGSVNVVIYFASVILAFIVLINPPQSMNYDQLSKGAVGRIKTVHSVILILSLIMAIISGLLIVGIIKRLHRLMMPWLILSGIGLIVQCGRFIFTFFGVLFSGGPISAALIILVVGVISIGISILILWPIFKLFGDIRQKNIEGTGIRNFSPEMAYKPPGNY